MTFQKLREIFHTRDDRQIKFHLADKITILDKETVKVTDPDLIKLFQELNDDQVLTLDEAAAMYNEQPYRLQWLAASGYVSFFKLADDKSRGAKILFQKSKLDEFFITDAEYVQRERSLVDKRELERMIITSCIKDNDIWRDVMIEFYVNMKNLNQIAEKYEVSKEAIRQKINKAGVKLSRNFRALLTKEEEANKYKEMYRKLYSEMQLYKSIAENPKLQLINKELGSEPVEKYFDEMSVRLQNSLGYMNCKSMNDILNLTEPQIRRYRNIGTKTITELKEFLAKYKLKLKES